MTHTKLRKFLLVLFLILPIIHRPLFANTLTSTKVKAISKNKSKKKSAAASRTNDHYQNKTLFESYSKILSMGQPIGYIINRYQLNDLKKRFYSTYFIKSGKPLDISESLHAEADYEMNPISYQYTSLKGKEAKTVDAKFEKGIMNVVISQNGRKEEIKKKVPQGAFLSTFLFYLMLKTKEGLKPDTNFYFKTAIAEEDASIVEGNALVGKETLWKGLQVYRVNQEFKKSTYVSYITDRGEILATETPSQGLSTEVVATSDEAIGNFGGESNIKLVFGEIPKGQDNIMARRQAAEKGSPNKSSTQKGIDVPPNSGIVIKPDNSTTTDSTTHKGK